MKIYQKGFFRKSDCKWPVSVFFSHIVGSRLYKDIISRNLIGTANNFVDFARLITDISYAIIDATRTMRIWGK